MQEEFCYVARDQLFESPWQMRRHYDDAKLQELAESIKNVGILTPLLVRFQPGVQSTERYEIGAGHRRFRAAALANLDRIPIRVQQMADAEFIKLIIVENLQREDIHPLDEALGYRALMAQGGSVVPSLIAAQVNKSTSYVYQRLKLADLIEPVQQVFLAGTINASHALLISRLQPQDQEKALHACCNHTYWGPDGKESRILSVRELSGWIEEQLHLDLHGVPFNKKDKMLVPTAGACHGSHRYVGR